MPSVVARGIACGVLPGALAFGFGCASGVTDDPGFEELSGGGSYGAGGFGRSDDGASPSSATSTSGGQVGAGGDGARGMGEGAGGGGAGGMGEGGSPPFVCVYDSPTRARARARRLCGQPPSGRSRSRATPEQRRRQRLSLARPAV